MKNIIYVIILCLFSIGAKAQDNFITFQLKKLKVVDQSFLAGLDSLLFISGECEMLVKSTNIFRYAITYMSQDEDGDIIHIEFMKEPIDSPNDFGYFVIKEVVFIIAGDDDELLSRLFKPTRHSKKFRYEYKLPAPEEFPFCWLFHKCGNLEILGMRCD